MVHAILAALVILVTVGLVVLYADSAVAIPAMVILTSIVVAVLYSEYLKNRVEVQLKARECVVMRHVLFSFVVVYGIRDEEQGVSYWPFWWRIDTKVNLNYERLLFGATSDKERGKDLFLLSKTKDNVALKIQGSYDIWIGREWETSNGKVVGTQPDAEAILSVVQTIDYDDHQQYVAERFKRALDAIIGNLTADELMFPSEHTTKIPKIKDEQDYQSGEVHSIAERDIALGIAQKNKANYALRELGLSVDNVTFTDISYEDSELQDAVERTHRVEKIKKSAQVLEDEGLTPAEQYSVGTDHQGSAHLAKIGESVKEGLIAIGKSIERAMTGKDQ